MRDKLSVDPAYKLVVRARQRAFVKSHAKVTHPKEALTWRSELLDRGVGDVDSGNDWKGSPGESGWGEVDQVDCKNDEHVAEQGSEGAAFGGDGASVQARTHPHPEIAGKTIRDVFEVDERPCLIPWAGRFDGFRPGTGRMSKTLLVSFGTNRYSVEAGRTVDIEARADRIRASWNRRHAGGAVAGSAHPREEPIPGSARRTGTAAGARRRTIRRIPHAG